MYIYNVYTEQDSGELVRRVSRKHQRGSLAAQRQAAVRAEAKAEVRCGLLLCEDLRNWFSDGDGAMRWGGRQAAEQGPCPARQVKADIQQGKSKPISSKASPTCNPARQAADVLWMSCCGCKFSSSSSPASNCGGCGCAIYMRRMVRFNCCSFACLQVAAHAWSASIDISITIDVYREKR